MKLNKPLHIDFDTWLWQEHNRARFTEADKLRAEIERLLSGRQA